MAWLFRFLWTRLFPPPTPPPPSTIEYIIENSATIGGGGIEPDPRTNNFVMSHGAFPAVGIVACLFFSLWIGPNRKSMGILRKLDAEMFRLYKFVRILMYGFLGGMLAYFAYCRAEYSLFDQPVQTESGKYEYEADTIVHFIWVYYVFKLVELLDVLFLIGINQNFDGFQLYHHTSAAAITWIGVKYFPGGSSVFPIICNCFSSLALLLSYLIIKNSRKHWKHIMKNIASAILVMQFGCIFLHSSIIFWLHGSYPRWGSGGLVAYTLSFGIFAGISMLKHRVQHFQSKRKRSDRPAVAIPSSPVLATVNRSPSSFPTSTSSPNLKQD